MAALREIEINDAAQISFLSSQLGYRADIEDTASQIAAVLSHPDHIAFVYIKENKIIGWIHAFKTLRIESKPFVEIGGLVVDENFRSQGIGRILVDKIKDWGRINNYSIVRVRCNTKREDAHKFYKRIGFSENKEQKVFQVVIV